MTYQIDFILTLGILRSTEPPARERALKMEKRKTVPQDEPEVPNKKDMKFVQNTLSRTPFIILSQ